MKRKREFREENYYSKYKVIMRLIRKYRPEDFLLFGKEYLYSEKRDVESIVEQKPWLIFLVAKWAFINAEQPGGRKLSWPSYLDILQKAWDLNKQTPLPSDYGYLNLFIRSLAQQQFPHYKKFEFGDFIRQQIHFEDTREDHYYHAEFQKITGMSMAKFSQMAVAVLTTVETNGSAVVEMDQIIGANNHFSAADVTSFLNVVSAPVETLGERLREATSNRSQPGQWTEYYETTPFVEFPFVRVKHPTEGKDYMYPCLHRNLLYRYLETIIYDILKRADPSKFMTHFGGDFERYTQRIISFYEYKYFTEKDLIKKSGGRGNSKVCDFVIQEDTANIFVETKAVEISHRGKVTTETSTLRNVVKNNSLILAIKQANSGRKIMSEIDGDTARTPYAVFVTYKEFFLGDAAAFCNAIVKTEIDRLVVEFGETMIPLENMFFLTLQEFELLLCNCRAAGKGIGEFLETTKGERMFSFGQHLSKAGFVEKPSFLHERTEALFDAVSAYFPESGSAAL